MINIKLSANGSRNTYVIDENTRIGEFLDSKGVNVSLTPAMLNGAMLGREDLNTTFATLGCNGEVLMTCVAKTSNAR